MKTLAERVDGISRKAEALSQLTGPAQQQALKPYLERAVAQHQHVARAMISKRLRDSGLNEHFGDLKFALDKVRLVLKWRGLVADLKLVIAPGLPDSMYRRIWSLDKGWKTSDNKKIKGRKCFTLSSQEKNLLGQQITSSAIALMKADERSRQHAG